MTFYELMNYYAEHVHENIPVFVAGYVASGLVHLFSDWLIARRYRVKK